MAKKKEWAKPGLRDLTMHAAAVMWLSGSLYEIEAILVMRNAEFHAEQEAQ